MTGSTPYRASPFVFPQPPPRRRSRWAVEWLHAHVDTEHRFERHGWILRALSPLLSLFHQPTFEGDLLYATLHRHSCIPCSYILYALGTERCSTPP